MMTTPTGSPATKTPSAFVGDLLALGLGANLGDSRATLRWAVEELDRIYGPLEVSPLYRTAPISPVPQPDFLNAVVLAALPALGSGDPDAVLDRAKALEQRAGRRAGERFGPRPLDVDVLLFGDLVRAEPRGAAAEQRAGRRRDLTLPHPRMRRRRFVLAPLHDLAPDLRLPPDGAAVSDLLAALGDEQRVEKIAWDDS